MPDTTQTDLSKSVTKEILLEIGGWKTFKEGQAIFEASHVENVKLEGNILSASVRSGTSHVNARLKIGKRLVDFDNLCSCRQAREYGTICPHVIALGLKFMNQTSEAPEVMKASSEEKKQSTDTIKKNRNAAKKLSRLNIIGVEDALSTTKNMQLHVVLPADINKAWKNKSIPVSIEASIQDAAPIGLDVVPRHVYDFYSVSEADRKLFKLIENINDGDTPGNWDLEEKDFPHFFNSLIDHPRVTIGKDGKKEPFKVTNATNKPKLLIDINKAGDLTLHLEEAADTQGSFLAASNGQWRLHDHTLELANQLRPAYQTLREKDMTISRKNLPDFYQNEFPYLGLEVDLELSDNCRLLKFKPTKPKFVLRIDGILSGISCKLEAVYDKKSFTLSGFPAPLDPNEEEWTPDPDDAYSYLTRHQNKEKEAMRELLAAGFLPGERQPEFYTLSSEKRVGHFLANIMPTWKKKWEILFSTRFGGFIEKCDYIVPEIDIQSSGEDWLALEIDYKISDSKESLDYKEIQRLLQTGQSHTKLASGRIALVPTNSIQQLQEVVYDCQAKAHESGFKIQERYVPYLNQALQNSLWKIANTSNWEPPKEIEAFQDISLDKSIEKILRPYQKTGINWLHYLSQNNFGGILADEMGLGKTLQTLSYLQYRRHQKLAKKPSLIICPTSLVQNWEQEAKKFTPDTKTLALHGVKRQASFKDIEKMDLVITSYALLRRDIDIYKVTDFDTVVLDEAQHIKNRSSQNAQSCKILKADHRIILTGTPIENSLLDLWSLMDFLMPGYLGPAKEFKDRYEIPISRFKDDTAQGRLNQRIRPFVLRRTKAEVAKDLPDKLENLSLVEMSDDQKMVYQSILQQSRKEVFKYAGTDPSEQNKHRMAVLTALTRLRQACCHLEMLPQLEDKTWEEPSAKMDYFFELLDQIVDGNHRALVFSQFVSLLKLTAKELKKRGIEFCYLDGSTTNRMDEVERFQNSPEIPVFLISLKAGGTGLNLTQADTVIHFDPWWNPAVEDQATARVHRIGQKKTVNSYKLIAKGTVEEKIVNLQQKKKSLFDKTLVSDEDFVRQLTMEELQNLLDD